MSLEAKIDELTASMQDLVNVVMSLKNEHEYMNMSQVAKYCGVSKQCVLNWLRAGKIKSYRPKGTKQHLFKRSEITVFLNPEASV